MKNRISGIVELNVIIAPLPSSNADVLLNSLFADEEALAAYQINPEHQLVGAFVSTVMIGRKCIDYFE